MCTLVPSSLRGIEVCVTTKTWSTVCVYICIKFRKVDFRRYGAKKYFFCDILRRTVARAIFREITRLPNPFLNCRRLSFRGRERETVARFGDYPGTHDDWNVPNVTYGPTIIDQPVSRTIFSDATTTLVSNVPLNRLTLPPAAVYGNRIENKTV